jgi:hypothetical protein
MKHKLNPVLDAQLNRNRKVRGHRRNFSDGRLTSSLTDNMADEVSYKFTQQVARDVWEKWRQQIRIHFLLYFPLMISNRNAIPFI